MQLNVTAAWGRQRAGWAGLRQRLASPSEHVSLERPAGVTRRIARVQAGVSVLVSAVVAVIGLIAVALPDEDRASVYALLALVAVAGGLMVGVTDLWIGRSLDVLVRSGSSLRQSAAERAADLARLNAELHRRDRERADLFSTMSHELRTPLNAIIGHSRLLLDDLDGELNEEQRTDVRQIHDGGLGLLRVVNGTLDFARLEAGAATIERAPVQVWAVAEEVVALLLPLAEVKGLHLTTAIRPNLPSVLADEERLRQVLVNLVGNALKFTRSGWVRLDAEVAGDGVTIAVQDSGIGISDDVLEQIFEPFRQAARGISRPYEGTGLGLAITRRLVELMGGRIWVESASGAGSTFSVSLARADDAYTVDADASEHQYAAEPFDVALVGDGLATEQLVIALADRGVAARRFSGPDWVSRAAAASPRLLLADVQQPQAGAWRALVEASRHQYLADARFGLVGVARDGEQYVGNVLTLPHMAAMPLAELHVALSNCLPNPAHGSAAPVLVVGADPGWRQRVTVQVQARGPGVYEAAHGEAALTVARRVPVSAVVIDLTVGGPGIAELLAELQAALGRCECSILVVAPAGLSPHEQRHLHLGSLSWLAADASPMSSLARAIAEQLAARKPELVAAGGR